MEKVIKTRKKREAKVVEAGANIKETKDCFILNGVFRVSKGNYSVITAAIKEKTNLMLIGDSGIGKTELVYNYCKAHNIDCTILDMGTMTDPITSLIGTHVITVEDGIQRSTFVKSRFSELIQKPGVILLDELSRASLMASNILFPCLDFRRELPMEYCFSDCTPIKIHPDCIFFATVNIGAQFSGTNKLDRALVDRFLTIKVDSPIGLDDILCYEFPSLNKEEIDKVVAAKVAISKKYKEFTCSFDLSLRHLKNICQLIKSGLVPYDAFYCICNGLAGEDGVKSITDIITKLKEA